MISHNTTSDNSNFQNLMKIKKNLMDLQDKHCSVKNIIDPNLKQEEMMKILTEVRPYLDELAKFTDAIDSKQNNLVKQIEMLNQSNLNVFFENKISQIESNVEAISVQIQKIQEKINNLPISNVDRNRIEKDIAFHVDYLRKCES
eukprot:TRINITY_DN11868_c0_g1_i1.p1 TRINITY_DN11868_c0_g1~~TRINITY_DN11868_c0_g1_i1.p1  ORF type:complete len:156 (-),score=47.16 TRINITY_DN11868_c0_g1_i1:1164-1598(-)